LSRLLGLPEGLLRGAGAILLPYIALLAWLSLRGQINRALIWAVILGNVMWTADSMLLLVSGWVSPTTAGYAFVIMQALVVLMYAELQIMGLRRSNAALA
jgi:ABC-type transport system involved in cytochrome bd biosynthesis fused ATPase/permease subunit